MQTHFRLNRPIWKPAKRMQCAATRSAAVASSEAAPEAAVHELYGDCKQELQVKDVDRRDLVAHTAPGRLQKALTRQPRRRQHQRQGKGRLRLGLLQRLRFGKVNSRQWYEA